MNDEDRDDEDVSRDPLPDYLEADARRQARAKKAHESEDVSRDKMDNLPESECNPLSDEELRLAISEPPSLPERQKVIKAASVLKRTHSAWSKIKSQEDWERACELTESDYFSGVFLIESLGGSRYLEPSMVATLLVLRENLVEQIGDPSTAEFMLIDMALLAFYNTLRSQRMLGDLVTQIEREFFRGESPSVNLEKNGPWKVEEMVNRASEKLLGLIDRANRMMIRNLKASQDVKKGNLTIRTDQINVAQNQVNQVVKKSRKRNSRGSSKGPAGDLPSDQ